MRVTRVGRDVTGWDRVQDSDDLAAFSSARLRQVLVARYGWDQGLEAWHDAVAYGWEHRERLAAMANPVGYLYRVAQSSVRRQHRWQRPVAFPAVDPSVLPHVEPGLPEAVAKLSPKQRTAVLLVVAYGWSQVEVADVLGIDVSTLRNHLRRGMQRLRTHLGVDDDRPD